MTIKQLKGWLISRHSIGKGYLSFAKSTSYIVEYIEKIWMENVNAPAVSPINCPTRQRRNIAS